MAIGFTKKPGYLKTDPPLKEKIEKASEIAAKIAVIPKNPRIGKSKRLVSIRYDEEIIKYFEATGMGWQTRMNAVLLDYIRRQKTG